MKVGDPITLVFQDRIVQCEVSFRGSNDDVFIACSATHLIADEGRLWLRGYRTPDSPAVAAARTAQALYDEKTNPLAGFATMTTSVQSRHSSYRFTRPNPKNELGE